MKLGARLHAGSRLSQYRNRICLVSRPCYSMVTVLQRSNVFSGEVYRRRKMFMSDLGLETATKGLDGPRRLVSGRKEGMYRGQ